MRCAANNLFVFPAIALAAHLGQTKIITDEMLMVAAEVRPWKCSGALCADATCSQRIGCSRSCEDLGEQLVEGAYRLLQQGRSLDSSAPLHACRHWQSWQ